MREGSFYTSTIQVVNVSALLDYAIFSCTARNSLGEDKLDIQLVSTSTYSLDFTVYDGVLFDQKHINKVNVTYAVFLLWSLLAYLSHLILLKILHMLVAILENCYTLHAVYYYYKKLTVR